jgi:hypothetical protein
MSDVDFRGDEKRAWWVIQRRHENEDRGLSRNEVDYLEYVDILAILNGLAPVEEPGG